MRYIVIKTYKRGCGWGKMQALVVSYRSFEHAYRQALVWCREGGFGAVIKQETKG